MFNLGPALPSKVSDSSPCPVEPVRRSIWISLVSLNSKISMTGSFASRVRELRGRTAPWLLFSQAAGRYGCRVVWLCF